MEHNKRILKEAEKVWGRTGRVGNLRLARRADFIINSCKIGPGVKVLEIGCGTGMFTKQLARTGAFVTAIDLFEGFLDIARNQVNAANVVFRVGQAEALEGFLEANFDAVCGVSVLHHLDIQSALRRVYRVLKPGGRIAFSEPNMLNPQIMIQKNIPIIKKLLGDSPDETAFFKWQIRKLFENAGFSGVEVTPFDFLHPATPDSLADFVVYCGNFLEKIPLLKETAGSLLIFARKP